MVIDYIPPPEAQLLSPPAIVAESAAQAAPLAAFARSGSDLIVNAPGGAVIFVDDFYRAERPLYQTRLELVDGGSNTFSFLVEDRHGNKVTDGSRLRAFFSEGGEFFAVAGIEADGKIIVELFQAAFDALADGEFASGTLTVFIGGEEYFVPMIINNTPTPGQST